MGIVSRLRTKMMIVFSCNYGRSKMNNHRMTMPFATHLNITTLCSQGLLEEALPHLYTTLDSSSYLQLLQVCIVKIALPEGKQFHSLITHRTFSFATRTFFQNTLVNMYAKCGSLVDARKVFGDMKERDSFSWNVVIAAYQRHGCPHEALTLFQQMQSTSVQPDAFTFSSILPACAKIKALEQGIDIHQSIMERGFLSDVVVANALVDMYAKCGSIHHSRELFDKIPQRSVISWNSMIAGYAQNELVEEALETFQQMQLAGLKPYSATFASILPACAKMGALEQGMNIHQIIIKSGFLSYVVVVSALIDMYAKCESAHKAHQLFDKMPERNVVSWTTMIAGYAQNDVFKKALETFKQMQFAGVKPNCTTFASILSACTKMGALEQGMDIHQRIIQRGYLSDVVVVNSLIDMYSKCGSILKARELFDKMSNRNVVSWTAIIAGYAQNGFIEKALEILKQMQMACVMPNSTTFASILPACAKMGNLEHGMYIHQSIIKSGYLSEVVVSNALIDMYAKCGSIRKARRLFNDMSQRNVISWTAMISAYAQNGFCTEALKLFELMMFSGTYPNHISFVCVLFACSHAGLVDEGCKYFNSMSDSYGIMPTMGHYVCMVDLFGRAGYLEVALNLIIKMPIKPPVVMWMCFLGACRSHKNIELGIFTATLLFELDPKNAAPYVLLSNIYAEVGRWGDVQQIRGIMKDRGINKMPGSSWVDVYKMVHMFSVGD